VVDINYLDALTGTAFYNNKLVPAYAGYRVAIWTLRKLSYETWTKVTSIIGLQFLAVTRQRFEEELRNILHRHSIDGVESNKWHFRDLVVCCNLSANIL
jgi:hypothetical protein